MQTITKKVPGGKLFRLKAGLQDGKLAAPQISGDFFLTPPEGIGALEEALEGLPHDATDDITEVLRYVLERDGMTLIGVSPEDVAEAAKELRNAD